ncbi:MAG TPA: ATP-binding cassette domain-containing protein, partial [Gaiellaceae bacterium]|nr:ATP-binding cassette domain-containing protein [Gaiellaceae bacterium]
MSELETGAAIMTLATTPDRARAEAHAGYPDDIVRFSSVTKEYGSGDTAVAALRDVSLDLARGSFTAVMGPSGSGKSTFLHCAAGLDQPTSGTVQLGGVSLGDLDEDARSRLRRERVGFVFQSFNLVPSLSAADNIALPLRLAGKSPDKA